MRNRAVVIPSLVMVRVLQENIIVPGVRKMAGRAINPEKSGMNTHTRIMKCTRLILERAARITAIV
jgi:hypothetical protein